MESIFGAQVLHPPVGLTAAQAPEAPADTTRSGPGARTILSALVVAIAAGALFTFMLDGPPPGSSTPGPPLGQEIPVAPTAMASAPAATTADMAPGPALASDPSPAAPVEAATASPSPAPRAAQPPPARVALRPALAGRARDVVERDATANDCLGGPGHDEARCGHEAMMTADRGLRRAYAQARRAGVSSEVLSNYNDRWTDLLHSPETPPLAVAEGYRALAAELRHAAAVEREHAEDLPEF